MAGTLLDLCFLLLLLNVESVLSVCDVRVHTIDFGCHLEWNCSNANPNTTYTVLAKQNKVNNCEIFKNFHLKILFLRRGSIQNIIVQEEWTNVLGCTQILRQSCDLSLVFPSLHTWNFIRLASEESLMGNATCDPLNDSVAKFSPPSINISVENGSLWVMVHFPCAPSTCSFDNTVCCPLNEWKILTATVTLYNKHNLTDRQSHTATVMEDITFMVEFGFLVPGQVYCAKANFTVEDVLASSPTSLPQCVYIPANTESLTIVIVCAVSISLVLVFLLLWRWSAPSERPLPRSLALLQEKEVQKETFVDSYMTELPNEISDDDFILVETSFDTCMTEPPNEISEDDHFFAVSYFLTESQSLYQNTQSLGNGHNSSSVLHNPGDIDEYVESGEMGIEDETHDSHLFPSSSSPERCRYQNQHEETLNIPLSSVWVKNSLQEETET